VAAELRAHLRGQQEPYGTAATLIAGEDGARFARAILEAPAALSGMTHAQVATLRDQARARFTPAEAAQSAEVDAALARLQNIGGALIKEVGSAIHSWTAEDRVAADIKAGLV
jgi:hypothetical protein